jgi:hypothetical protein
MGFTVTELLDVQSTDATNEKRVEPLGVNKLVIDSSPAVDFITPSIRAQMESQSSLRDVQIPVLQDQTPTVVTTPGFEFIPSNIATSAQYTFTAVDIFSGMRHYPAQFANNAMDSEWVRRQTMSNVLHQMAITSETLLLTEFENRKTQLLDFTTQVSQGDGTYTFDAPSDTLQINKAAQKEGMFFELEALMAANKLRGNYRIVTNEAGLTVQKSQLLENGVANTRNLQSRGFFPLDNMYESSNVAAGSDIFNGWLVRDGAIGVVENFPYDFRVNTVLGDGQQWDVSDGPLPFLNMRANIYINNSATEATALTSGNDSNMIMTHFEEMAIWCRFYIVYEYNSDLTTRANDIVKLQGLTT